MFTVNIAAINIGFVSRWNPSGKIDFNDGDGYPQSQGTTLTERISNFDSSRFSKSLSTRLKLPTKSNYLYLLQAKTFKLVLKPIRCTCVCVCVCVCAYQSFEAFTVEGETAILEQFGIPSQSERNSANNNKHSLTIAPTAA